MGTINSSDRLAVILYSLGTLFVSGIHVYIPCIKEIVMMIIILIDWPVGCHPVAVVIMHVHKCEIKDQGSKQWRTQDFCSGGFNKFS
jgi:multisubunit Na+/H+ antiporter MnhG subunit